ncbi:MAG TPA: transposase [Kofleriaceae bacterium]|nr:transposase [Kofleriaceae bacterium]
MARARKRHVQQSMTFRSHGGARPGAGRKPNGSRAGQPHARRPPVRASQPVHVTLRVAPDIRQLRTRDLYHAIRRATLAALRRDDFRIVHLSIQHDHVHLIAEADGRLHLSRGVRAFEISAARQINRTISARRPARPRTGAVFPDRYHARVLNSPRSVRAAICYVVNNWRKHGEDRTALLRHYEIDPFSSGISFTGWRELEGRAWLWQPPPSYEPLRVRRPRSWLLAHGWRRAGAIGVRDVPGASSRPEM